MCDWSLGNNETPYTLVTFVIKLSLGVNKALEES
jgi:hypothetical protein